MLQHLLSKSLLVPTQHQVPVQHLQAQLIRCHRISASSSSTTF